MRPRSRSQGSGLIWARWPTRPAATPINYFAETYGSRPVRGTVESIQQVGHIVLLVIIIGAAQPIIVEGHADKYAGRFRDGEDVQLAWKKNVATLVSH